MKDVKELLPHRDPFLFLDELTEVSKEKITGKRVYTSSEFFFKGHFPDYPVVPGVVLVESMAQCGGAGINELGILNDDALFFLATIEKAKFRKQVVPGDEVRFEIENVRISSKMLKQKGKAYVGDEVAAEAEWLCIVGSK